MTTVNLDLFHKFQNVKKLQTSENVEVREDEEQSIKLQEIIDLLVAAGYFRARIKGLSSFDKIVGGMTWCIESCNVDLDVDLLFQENSTIGQKIALTEKIVSVLPKMKCPHRIEPHQIQGLDFVHIWPVMQWLVKRSMEFREEMSSFVRAYSVEQFNREFSTDAVDDENQQRVLQNLTTVQHVYRPRRYFMRKSAPPEDMDSKVQITLLEYGSGKDAFSSTAKTNKTDSWEESEELDFNNLRNMLTDTNQANVDEFALSKEEQRELLNHYALLQSEMEGGLKSDEEKKRWASEQSRQLLANKVVKLESENKNLEESIAQVTHELETLTLKQQEANEILKELDLNQVPHSSDLEEIQKLIAINDELKTQESEFKEKCKVELAQLKEKIRVAKMATPKELDPNLHRQIEEHAESIIALRLQLAKKNRNIAALQRKLDDVPSSSELAQYQKRFLELYNQVAAKHKETKQYYTLYNSLEETRMYISKELSLLNSIYDSYPEAMLSTNGKEEFLKQLETIVEGVTQSKEKVCHKVTQEQLKRDQLAHKLQTLNEKQRQYVATVQQLELEFRKHEALLAKQQQNSTT